MKLTMKRKHNETQKAYRRRLKYEASKVKLHLKGKYLHQHYIRELPQATESGQILPSKFLLIGITYRKNGEHEVSTRGRIL